MTEQFSVATRDREQWEHLVKHVKTLLRVCQGCHADVCDGVDTDRRLKKEKRNKREAVDKQHSRNDGICIYA